MLICVLYFGSSISIDTTAVLIYFETELCKAQRYCFALYQIRAEKVFRVNRLLHSCLSVTSQIESYTFLLVCDVTDRVIHSCLFVTSPIEIYTFLLVCDVTDRDLHIPVCLWRHRYRFTHSCLSMTSPILTHFCLFVTSPIEIYIFLLVCDVIDGNLHISACLWRHR